MNLSGKEIKRNYDLDNEHYPELMEVEVRAFSTGESE